ncbi:hypothetical protein L1049_021458 [Liquidambar formosana]
MDILISANQSLSHYYMAARHFDHVAQNENYDKTNVTAILQYRGNYTPPSYPSFPTTLPGYRDTFAAFLFTNRFRSLASEDHPVNVPLNISTRMFITADIKSIMFPDNLTNLASSLNNISWANPSIDVLLAYYSSLRLASPVMEACLGVWFWHCHLDEHLTWGMSTVFIVKNGGSPETSIRDPPPYMPPCEAQFPRLRESDDSTRKENKLNMI